ncbi:GMC oxidoreductase [Mycolicibacterium sp. PO1]
MQPDYDVVIIGSGFGGSVTALRLTEKGYRVLVIEAGRRYEDDDFAKTSWNLRKFLWAPALGCFGIQRIHLLRNVMILAGAGVGGGSLNYANTLYVPPEPFFNDPQWKDITDWRGELMPHYDQAQRMLGVVTNPTVTDADKIMQQVADDMGVGDTWVPTPVGVFFGNDGEKTPGKTVPDPYFGGAGPARTGCIECGSCMTGCRYGAKNTLLKNYLGLAEKAGAHVRAMSTVTDFRQRPDDLWEVRTVRTGSKLRRGKRTVTATHVVLAAGTYGTQRLLFKMRDTGRLPQLVGPSRGADADQLGVDRRRRTPRGLPGHGSDPRRGDHVVHPSHRRHPCRTVPLRQGLQCDGPAADADDRRRRPAGHRRAAVAAAAAARGRGSAGNAADAQPAPVERAHRHRAGDAASRQLDHHLHQAQPVRHPPLLEQTGPRRTQPVLDPGRQRGDPPHRREDRRGRGRHVGELFNIPLTAHFLGGAAIGDNADHGVIDPYHRVYHYPTLSVVDGAAISANLGVNPSLSITAQAERAAALWPNKGEQDLRPAQGEAYRRLTPIAPAHPVVPAEAPAALRNLPIEPVSSAG